MVDGPISLVPEPINDPRLERLEDQVAELVGGGTGAGQVRLITVQEMAKILGVPVSWLYQRTRLGPETIPFIRVGKYIRFSPEEVVAFLRAKGHDGKGSGNGVS